MVITIFALIFFHLLAWNPNLEKNSIYSNKFFNNFHMSESSFTCCVGSGMWISAKTVLFSLVWIQFYLSHCSGMWISTKTVIAIHISLNTHSHLILCVLYCFRRIFLFSPFSLFPLRLWCLTPPSTIFQLYRRNFPLILTNNNIYYHAS